MPTEEQLDIIWESQLEFFGGSGLPKQNYDMGMDGYGLAMEKNVDSPLVSKNSFLNFKGMRIGDIIFNADTKEFKIRVDINNEKPDP